jgi:hypothetical protein
MIPSMDQEQREEFIPDYNKCNVLKKSNDISDVHQQYGNEVFLW